MLNINLETLPEYGEEIKGSIAEDIFALPEHDAKPAGPMKYELRAQRLEEELLLTGQLYAPFTVECTGCLRSYKYEIDLQEIAVAVSIESTVVDATEALREEVLIHFPAHPRCTDSAEYSHCEINPKYLAVDKVANSDLNPDPASEEDSKWAALDAFQPDISDESQSS